MSVVLLFYCPLLSGLLLNTLAVHRFWWNFSQRKLLVKLFVVNFIVALMGNKKSNRCLFSAGGSRFGITYLFFKGNGVGRGEREGRHIIKIAIGVFPVNISKGGISVLKMQLYYLLPFLSFFPLFLMRLIFIEIEEKKFSFQTIGANDFAVFKGIPYAAPPVGSLRFQVSAYCTSCVRDFSAVTSLFENYFRVLFCFFHIIVAWEQIWRISSPNICFFFARKVPFQCAHLSYS